MFRYKFIWMYNCACTYVNALFLKNRNTDDVLKSGKWVRSTPYSIHFTPCAIYFSSRLRTWEVLLKGISLQTWIEQFWIIGFNCGRTTRLWNLVLICSFYWSSLKNEVRNSISKRIYIYDHVFLSSLCRNENTRKNIVRNEGDRGTFFGIFSVFLKFFLGFYLFSYGTQFKKCNF